MEKMQVELGAVQETLLIPLFGRAAETRKARGLIHDPKAVEIVESLNYDFDKWKGQDALAGASLRTRIFDAEVQAFLDEHPEGTVVEIGAGLNTRYERLDNGRARWLELDLPDSMALRRRFFEDTARRTMISASFVDREWHDAVAQSPGPYCFVSEAVIIYLEEALVREGIRNLADRFGDGSARLIMDTITGRLVETQGRRGIMKTMSPDSYYRWKCDDPAALESWGLRLVYSKTVFDTGPELRRRMPPIYRFMIAALPWLLRRLTAGYNPLNRFTIVRP